MSVVNSGFSRQKFTKFLRDIERTSGVSTRPPLCHPDIHCGMRAQEGRPFADFAASVPLSHGETNTRSNICSRMSTNPENLKKIRLVGSEISLLQAMKKKVTAVKHKQAGLQPVDLMGLTVKKHYYFPVLIDLKA